MIKGDGGAVGLTEDASALRRWMVSGPEISRLIEQFEYDNRVKADFRHHEETETNQTSFLTNVKQMTRTLDELGSPFMEETKNFIVLDSKKIADIKISESHGHLVKLGMDDSPKLCQMGQLHFMILLEGTNCHFSAENLQQMSVQANQSF